MKKTMEVTTMAQTFKTPLELIGAKIRPENKFGVRSGAYYNDEIDINKKVNEIGKPTKVDVNHPPRGSYPGYKWTSLRLPRKWQRYKDPFAQSQNLVSEEDVKNKAIERWSKLPEEIRNDVGLEYARELDPFDFSEDDFVPTSLQDDIDYFKGDYFTPNEWEILDRVLKGRGY